MAEEITIGSELRRLRDAEPFRPFAIIMSSGERYRVDDAPEIILAREAIVLVPLQRRSQSTLRMNHVSSIDLIEPTSEEDH
jgi:hypothetical protein